MAAFQDLTGRRFGDLLVESRASNRGGKVMWWCRCGCGTVKAIPAVQLTHDGTRSCGCFRKKNPADRAIRTILENYKRSAAKRHLSWTLPDRAGKHLLAGNCYYCGSPPDNVWRFAGPNSPVALVYSGIDRKDNRGGYEWDNVVSCCGPCNLAKHTQGFEEFLGRVRRIAARHPECHDV